MFLFSHIQSQNWHYNKSFSVTSYLYTMELFICISELMSYFGASQSGLIAWRLIKMENLTILNKMLLIYFSLDFVFGTAEAYFLSKLFRERLEKHTFSSGMKNIYIFLGWLMSLIHNWTTVSIFWPSGWFGPLIGWCFWWQWCS